MLYLRELLRLSSFAQFFALASSFSHSRDAFEPRLNWALISIFGYLNKLEIVCQMLLPNA